MASDGDAENDRTDIVEQLHDLLAAALPPDRRAVIEQAADELERLRAELRDPIMRRMENDRFGISISWDDYMISGMQRSTDEVWRLAHIVKILQREHPDIHDHLRKIANQMLEFIERTQADRRYTPEVIEELRRDFPDLFDRVV